jgi:hypothetical protein
MAESPRPLHERVTLTPHELRTLAEIERSLTVPEEAAPPPPRRRGRLRRWLPWRRRGKHRR